MTRRQPRFVTVEQITRYGNALREGHHHVEALRLAGISAAQWHDLNQSGAYERELIALSRLRDQQDYAKRLRVKRAERSVRINWSMCPCGNPLRVDDGADARFCGRCRRALDDFWSGLADDLGHGRRRPAR